MQSDRLMEYDKAKLGRLAENRLERPAELYGSLKLLTRLLHKHYGISAIVMIDEYDVPLDQAYHNGYYTQMVNLVRSVFSQALKMNERFDKSRRKLDCKIECGIWYWVYRYYDLDSI